MKIAVLYVGASLPGPLRQAEQDIQSRNKLDLTISAHNCGGDLTESEFLSLDGDLATADIVFIIHVTNQENAGRIIQSLERHRTGHLAVIAINCMPDLMRRTRLGNLDFAKMMKARTGVAGAEAAGLHSPVTGEESAETPDSLLRRAAAWMADSIRGGRKSKTRSGPPAIANYTGLITRLPSVLKFLPTAGKLTDIKHYLFLFCYFLQPTPDNIRSMLLYAIKHYVPGYKRLRVAPPESLPAVGIYHPDAPDLFATFGDYRKWYEKNRKLTLTSGHTVGLLLMRPQIISKTRRHYDCLIRAIEREGLAVIPAISTFMDNRDACRQFFVDADQTNGGRKRRSEPPKGRDQSTLVEAAGLPAASVKARVSQIVSLTGFSFVVGPAMND
ncbi:MAG TPA: cobaltochelatase subunit CobN, partial [Blastocatellia bacterium]|nr:cobaltochelatase subunit CobN [Blastocatellia bacterium]